ncbi:MAG: AbrB/MazE/SpoVT family DNA-binding domain-containing protein [Cyanobacteria bacterium]|jgi:antitoxin PrlF|nr:AbrB/MazE/SpoVT family DNA-binding domain-containing protein [Synechococcus sp. CS-1331]MDA0887827.1 AbrB/MazE/SpoVT family DNA-binding domain-containing protein [Cyanobacteriota bacterium]
MSPMRPNGLREVLMVSSRGQVTLPAEMRRHLGIEPGGAVIVEECEGELRIKPAALIEVETYNDDQIAAWDRADILGPKERGQILARLQQA